jgi:acyl dehydratase
METVEFVEPPTPASLFLAALRSARKRAAAGASLPELCYVRPRVVLEPAHVERYAKTCGFSPAHGLPPIYPQMLSFPLVMALLVSDRCPWPALGTVHLANRIRQWQRIGLRDELRVEVATGQLLAHEKGQVFTLGIRVSRDGELVWEATQTLLRVGVREAQGAAYVARPPASAPLSRQADLHASADIGRRYARVSGDFNPIHLSAPSARLFGFRRAIAHGMWTKARALAALLPAQTLDRAEIDVEFKLPLYLPARVTLWSHREADGASFEVRNAAGDRPHLRGVLRY